MLLLVISLPKTTLSLLSLSLQTINGNDVFDDAGLPYVYGASKILDMLGYGSFLASSNTAKAAITSAYLGKPLLLTLAILWFIVLVRL